MAYILNLWQGLEQLRDWRGMVLIKLLLDNHPAAATRISSN